MSGDDDEWKKELTQTVQNLGESMKSAVVKIYDQQTAILTKVAESAAQAKASPEDDETDQSRKKAEDPETTKQPDSKAKPDKTEAETEAEAGAKAETEAAATDSSKSSDQSSADRPGSEKPPKKAEEWI